MPASTKKGVLALDPGTTTGWAMYLGNFDFSHGQVSQDKIWGFLDGFEYLQGPLIVERFVYRHLPKVELTPVKVIGIIEEWARQHSFDVVFQTPSQAMFFYTDARLKSFGVYQPGKPHAMDAMRHLLYYLKWLPKAPS